MTALFWIGRILFSMIFIMSGLNHFMQVGPMSRYAESKGVPAPRLLTVASGIVILAGGLSIFFWWEVTVGVWLLIGFLLMAGLVMHDFWAAEDLQTRQSEMAQFMKNMALAGAALVFFVLLQSPSLGR